MGYTLSDKDRDKLQGVINYVEGIGTNLVGRRPTSLPCPMPVCLISVGASEGGVGVYDCTMCSPNYDGTDFDPSATPDLSIMLASSSSNALMSDAPTGYAINLAETGGTGHCLPEGGIFPAILWSYNSDGKAVFFFWGFDFVSCT